VCFYFAHIDTMDILLMLFVGYRLCRNELDPITTVQTLAATCQVSIDILISYQSESLSLSFYIR